MTSPENYFELFGLTVDYAIDHDALHKAWLGLQKQTHPDSQTAEADGSQAAHINQAYRTLNEAYQRSIYLLSLKSYDVPAEQTVKNIAFLEEMMAYQEELARLRANEDQAGLQTLATNLTEKIVQIDDQLVQLFASPDYHNSILTHLESIEDVVAEFKFYLRLREQVSANG